MCLTIKDNNDVDASFKSCIFNVIGRDVPNPEFPDSEIKYSSLDSGGNSNS